jgi:hypothetical protein
MGNNLEILAKAWEQREGPAVLATVDANGNPNVIYVGDLKYDAHVGFVIVDNYFCKTRANLKHGKSGAFLFITKEHKAFQVKGSMRYLTEGPVFEDMKKWHNQKHPGIAAVVLQVEEVYNGADKLYG